MKLTEMKKKAFALIEELAPKSEYLTDDPDIQAKANYVINQRMFELARYKKIPKYVEINVTEGQILTFGDLETACGYEVYQLKRAFGVSVELLADATVIKCLEGGVLCVELYVYPERISEKTKDNSYEFELSADVLEIMPYGIAADLLMNDESANYGRIYSDKYEAMKQMLDTRHASVSLRIRGGF